MPHHNKASHDTAVHRGHVDDTAASDGSGLQQSRAVISTGSASRYLVQFCRHMQSVQTRTDAAVTVSFTAERGEIATPAGEVRLQAQEKALVVEVVAPTAAGVGVLQARAARNLERFGKREGLTVCWTDCGSQPEPPAPIV